jgi:N-acetylglutamate synthase-like GNAT family acetyltransferase
LSFVDALQRRFANCLGFLPIQALESYLSKGRVKLVYENDEPAGYILGQTHLACSSHVMPLTQTAITFELQRQQHGLVLVQSAIDEAIAAGRSIVQAWCRVDLEANHFWRAAGFTAVAIRRPKTTRQQPLVLWRRSLNKLGDATLLHIPAAAGYRASRSDPRRILTAKDVERYLHLPMVEDGQQRDVDAEAASRTVSKPTILLP